MRKTISLIKKELGPNIYIIKNNFILLFFFVAIVRRPVRLLLIFKILLTLASLAKIPLILYKKQLNTKNVFDIAIIKIVLAVKSEKGKEVLLKLTLNYLIIFIMGVSVKTFKISVQLYNIMKLKWYAGVPPLGKLREIFYEEFFFDKRHLFEIVGKEVKILNRSILIT